MADAARSLVGREEELESLRALIAGAREGRSGVLCVYGPAGQGKTALLDRLVSECADVEVVRATGIERESEVPFATLDAVARPLMEHLEHVPAAQRSALEAALALSADGSAAPFAISAGTLSLLAAAADVRPLLVVVDDLHWVDEASRDALLFAARRLEREAIAVVLAQRGDEAPAVDVRGFETLRIGPLSDAECSSILDQASGGRMPPETASQLVAAAAGNPLTLVELMARLTPDELAGREVLVGPPPPNADATGLLAERITALSDEAREALLIATTTADAGADVLRAALEDAGLSLDSLLAAEEAGLVELRAGRVALRHPLVRSVAYHSAEPAARRRAHGAVAAALPAASPRRPWHLAAAATGPDEDVAAALEAESERGRMRGGYLAAGRALARAADMTPDPERRVARLLAASNGFEFGGHFEEALRVTGEASGLTEDPVALARIQGVRASISLRFGRTREAREAMLGVARTLAALSPGAAARYFLQSSFASMTLADGAGWEEHARDGLEAAADDTPSTVGAAEAILGAALIANGKVEEAEPLVARSFERILGRPEDEPTGGAVEVYALLARSLLWIERWDEADRLLARLERDARRLNTIAGLPYILNMRCAGDVHLGRWGTAEVAVTEQISLAGDIGDQLFLDVGHASAAWLAAMRGRKEECEAAAALALEGSGEASVGIAVWARNALGLLALGAGDIDRAVTELSWVTDRPSFDQPGSRIWTADLIEALIRAGDVEGASERLSAWEADAERTQRVHGLATVARLRGLLAPDDGIDSWFSRALEHHSRSPMPWQEARTLYCHGERLRRAKRRNDARKPLRDALAIFERLGSGDWANRTRTELRATGGMVPAKARAELDELTPHELQVARLVAEGRTNREVAAALFLAPKTIEHHLSAIFRKLDIKRRTELARVFATELAG